MKNQFFIACFLLICLSCHKADNTPANVVSVADRTETNNGVTYRLFIDTGRASYKGIVVMGSGNDESNPSPGSLTGAAEIEFCTKAATNGYAAAIVQYSKTPGVSDWNGSSQIIGNDYDKCIQALSDLYHITKSNSVVGGFSYASYQLLTNVSSYTTLSYTKGVLAACGAAGEWDAEHFIVPVYSIACSGNNEGDYSGQALYDKIPASSAIKAASGGVTDSSCSTHCGGDWTNQMYDKLVKWIP